MIGLLCDSGEALQNVLRETDHFAAHPLRGQQEGAADGDELDGERKRLLLNLRQGLDEADENTDNRRDDDWQHGQLQNDDERLDGVVQNFTLSLAVWENSETR